MQGHAKTDDERLFYLGNELETLRQTFFRQVTFAEFERATHARVDTGEPLTGEDMTAVYCALLERHHGARERYLALLAAGGSGYPYELVKAAGVDLATPAPYEALFARMNRLMHEIEAILARRKSG